MPNTEKLNSWQYSVEALLNHGHELVLKYLSFLSLGVRLHFHTLVKGLTAQAASKAQLGLGHSYSRAKVKFNVNRADNMIIQSIALLDQLDKDINTFSMRVRYVGWSEWWCYTGELIQGSAGCPCMVCEPGN